MNFNIFTYTLPFVAFILDHSTKRLNNKPEKALYIIIKLILIIYYLGAYVLALQEVSSDSHFLICLINFIAFPVLTLIYGFMLRKGKLG